MNNINVHLRRLLVHILLLVMMLLAIAPVNTFAGSDAYPFNQGRSRFSLQIGNTRAFHQTYSVVGIGAGYYIKDGLEAGLDGDAWLGDTPDIYRISPGLRYTWYSREMIKPYTGIFYRRTFIENSKDQNEAGGRAGLTVLNGPRTSFSVGLVYDARINCDKAIYSSCSDLYTELGFAVLF